MDTHFVYLIACQQTLFTAAVRARQKDVLTYVKIGLSSSLQRRLCNIQTGCPHPITHAFVVRSEYLEEIQGLEKLLHLLLRPERLRGEWYLG